MVNSLRILGLRNQVDPRSTTSTSACVIRCVVVGIHMGSSALNSSDHRMTIQVESSRRPWLMKNSRIGPSRSVSNETNIHLLIPPTGCISTLHFPRQRSATLF